MTLRYDHASGSEKTYDTVNPAAPSETVGRYAIPDEAETAAIITRANAAAAEWARVPGLERGQRLNAFLDAVVARVDEIAEAITLEQGKILAEAKAEILKGCAEGRFMVGEAARMGATPIADGRPNFSNQILRRPRGVIFCISPWNFPAMTPLRKMCPAIAFGNAVIMKPSQFTPAASFLLEEIARAHLPAHLYQNAMISGRAASEVIAKGDIQGVSFTGSVEVGRLVYSAAAQNLIPVQLELGGKNAAILSDTDDLAGAVQQIAAAAFQTGGQRCTAISRVLVQRDLAKQASALLAERADAITLGSGMADGVQMGPLCNLPHWDGVCANTAKAIDEGSIALAGGGAAEGAGAEGGYFFRPTILGNVAHDSTASQVEIFGPVLSVLEYDTFDQAMEMLNGTEFGLTSALFSNNNAHVQRFLKESNNGMLHVNHGTIPDNNMPFGGIKNSGVGAYSVGPTAVNFYTSEHAAYVTW
ncbi:aldehyde dehydrogenase family protein [Pacificoceanicola onchidii]|uniref:aldehyde dehydrogenase family protein n=1 Tax=Pacificoceanicola onchidii TaxID=2562685 RepID=UPI00197FC262|nr:aldehyde dehydrogenase family protein [Pacificoceanicola onchidii]